jgi:hypothetical protein
MGPGVYVTSLAPEGRVVSDARAGADLLGFAADGLAGFDARAEALARARERDALVRDFEVPFLAAGAERDRFFMRRILALYFWEP